MIGLGSNGRSRRAISTWRTEARGRINTSFSKAYRRLRRTGYPGGGGGDGSNVPERNRTNTLRLFEGNWTLFAQTRNQPVDAQPDAGVEEGLGLQVEFERQVEGPDSPADVPLGMMRVARWCPFR